MITPFFILWIVCAIITLVVVITLVAACVITRKEKRSTRSIDAKKENIYMIGPVVFTEPDKPSKH